MFHTHALGHLATDGPKPNDGSTGVEAQWGVRPCGGLSVSEIDTNTTLISVGIRFYYRKSYYTHTQAVMGFLYHRDNGIWERVFDNDEADFDSDNQLWLDAFARNSLVDNRNFVSWVRFSEPSNFEQISGSLSLPRSVEAVYARVSSDGRYLTQFQYIGDPVGLCASTLIAATTTGTKILCAVGHSQVLSSPPAHFVCDVPDSYKVDMEMFTSGYVVDKGNQWNFAIASNLEAGAVRFTEELREGDLIRAYQGIEGELMQIGQAYIDTTAPAISLMARQHKGPLQARAELMLYGTKAEVIDDIFPMETVTIEPIHPGGPGATIFTEDGEEITVHHPANIALNRGYWALRKTRWPALFFGGIYDYLANKLTYRMSGHMWAFTGGGPVDLPPGVYGGPGSVADEFRTYKRGTFFNDIVWTIVEPRVDGAIQSAVRFGDDRNYGNFTFDALTGCDVEANIIRNNGLITQIEYSSDDCAGGEVWNTVLQESCAAGLICRSVQHDLDEKGTGKKYIFVWEANSDFTTGSHLEDQAGRFWGKLVFDKPDYGSQPIGQNKLYLIISDFDESDENWQTNESWVHKAIQHTDATGLTTGHPADLKMQVLGGT
ncbi:MAG: hypothetical protein GY934_06890, partial [Gammaproteobacteria bacterium]|nr:hypothetical protein [Gammaproteobacteria bacterium]